MTLLLLSILVRKLLILLNNTYLWFRRKLSSERRSESNIRFIHLSLVLTFSLIFLFLIPSVIFTYLEESWSFIDAFYFCFISLTTIGLGDLVAGDSPTQRNRLFYKFGLTGREKKRTFLRFLLRLSSVPVGRSDNYDAFGSDGFSNAWTSSNPVLPQRKRSGTWKRTHIDQWNIGLAVVIPFVVVSLVRHPRFTGEPSVSSTNEWQNRTGHYSWSQHKLNRKRMIILTMRLRIVKWWIA